jgi:hypothetical protein
MHAAAAAAAQVWRQECIICVNLLPLLWLLQHWYVPCTCCIKVHPIWWAWQGLQQVTQVEGTLATCL